MRSRILRTLLVAGALAPATAALGGGTATAQLPPLLPTTTTTTTPPTTTTTAPPATTSTTTADGPATTTTTSGSDDVTTTTTSGATEPDLDADEPQATSALSGNGLSITVPDAVVLSPGTPLSAPSLSAELGTVTVEDARSGLNRSWSATVTATDFTTGGGSPAETIRAGRIGYRSGPATSRSGIAALFPGQALLAPEVRLDEQRTAFAVGGATGTVTVSWNPTVTVHIPDGVAVGEYRGTITHSVA